MNAENPQATQEPPTINRATAAKINPLISSVCASETLLNAADAIGDIGDLLSCADDLDGISSKIYLLLNPAAAALKWEAEEISSAKRARVEAKA